jgi:hypothetical protein
MKTCPKCKLINPDSAMRCDCGWDFMENRMNVSYISEIRDWQVQPWYKRGTIAGTKFALIGAIFTFFTFLLRAIFAFSHSHISSTHKFFNIIYDKILIKFLVILFYACIGFLFGFLWGVIRKNNTNK